MKFKPKVKIQLIKCTTRGCGKSYNNPLTHTCVIRIDKPPARKRTAAKKTTTRKKRK